MPRETGFSYADPALVLVAGRDECPGRHAAIEWMAVYRAVRAADIRVARTT